MTPTDFPLSNTHYGPPADLDESQCATIPAWCGVAAQGSCEGAPLTVTAWQPSPAEIAALVGGAPVFFTCIGGLIPHFLTTSFHEAVNPV